MSVGSKQRKRETLFLFEGFAVSSHQLDLLASPLTTFEQKVVDFARLWLSDKPDFEFMTSGSTGKPQKTKFSRAQIQASAQLTQQTFELKAGQKALLCLDPDFIAGKMMIVRALETGMNLVCISPSADPLESLKADLAIDFTALVPYQLEAILRSQPSAKKLNQIKKVIVGGAPVPDDLTQRLQFFSTQFYETYGMTETLTHVAVRNLNPPEVGFRALPGVKLYLDSRSCLNIQANHLGNEVILTNDLVNIFGDSSFSLIGRYDNIINTAGLKVSPEDVERRIATILWNHLNGCEYFVGGVKDKSFGERVVLFIEGAELAISVKDRQIELMSSHLRKWEVPKEIICVPLFKRTSSGKVNRRETMASAIAHKQF